MDKYIYMTVYQFADAIASAPWNTLFDFTYDSKQCEDDIPDPTGWYGMKIARLFDEAGFVQRFRVESINKLLNETQMEHWTRTKEQVWSEFGINYRHRAAQDVSVLQETYRRIEKLG